MLIYSALNVSVIRKIRVSVIPKFFPFPAFPPRRDIPFALLLSFSLSLIPFFLFSTVVWILLKLLSGSASNLCYDSLLLRLVLTLRVRLLSFQGRALLSVVSSFEGKSCAWLKFHSYLPSSYRKSCLSNLLNRKFSRKCMPCLSRYAS